MYNSNTTESLNLVFKPDRTEDRKEWLRGAGVKAAYTEDDVSYEDFVHSDLIDFSTYNTFRSIPSVVDGLKPTQRKVLYTCMTKNIVNDVKVVQLAGAVADLTAYHHGDRSLLSTITKMAQNFVGSNNVPLLVPSGQFGTRHSGGDDAASARYIFTRLSPIAKYIYRDEDSAILKHIAEDGKEVEPVSYLPVIPMILVNGGFGVGTGWSTFVPQFNPIAVTRHVANIVR
jgi:DNA topoisomerase II